MTNDPKLFVYWLHGFFEIRDASPAKDEPLTKEQVQVIRDHLDLVFTKATPDRRYNLTEMAKLLNTGGKPEDKQYC